MNYTTITFPGLGLELNPGRFLDIGGFKIYYYGIIIACGMLLAALYALRRCKEFGLRQDDIYDGLLWVAPLAVVCARLYYCIFAWEEGGYSKNLWSIFAIRDGGLAIYGGVLGAVIGMAVFTKIKRIKLTALLDVVSLGFLIGQAVGRWGNFFNREAFGAATDGFLRMGLLNSYTGQVEYHHPTFLYESLWNAAGFLLLHFLSKKRRYDGQIALGYAAWYGLGRMCIEGLRTDSLYLGPLRVSQWLAGGSLVLAGAVLIWQATRKHDPQKLLVRQAAAAEAAKAAEEAESEQ